MPRKLTPSQRVHEFPWIFVQGKVCVGAAYELPPLLSKQSWPPEFEALTHALLSYSFGKNLIRSTRKSLVTAHHQLVDRDNEQACPSSLRNPLHGLLVRKVAYEYSDKNPCRLPLRWRSFSVVLDP